MVRVKKLTTLSLLLSFITIPFLSAMTVDELPSSRVGLDNQISLNELDLEQVTYTFHPSKVRSEGIGEKVGLHFDKNGFFVSDAHGSHRVQQTDIDPQIRDISSVEDMILFAVNGNKMKVKRFDTGEYSVVHASELKGGGLVGAWIGSTLGYGLVTFAGHSLILGASALTGPFAPATFNTLEAMCAIPIHSAASAAGVAGGVAGGVATGPV